MKYANIIFIQSVFSHTQEHEGIYEVWDSLCTWPNEEDEKRLFHYLEQWDYGRHSEDEISTEPGAGSGDTVRKFGDYILTYNTKLGYAGLERILSEMPVI